MVLNDVVLCGVGSGAECCSEYDAEYMCIMCVSQSVSQCPAIL